MSGMSLGRRGAIARRKSSPTPDPVGPDSLFKPVSYTTLAEARTALGAPSGANYVMWNHNGQSLEQVFASLGTNDILVLPERAEPYPIDTSKGFMASGVASVTGPNDTRSPIVSNSRLWFAMCRARRGIIGLGPNAVIQPTNSSWSEPAQPRPMFAYDSSGNQIQELVGAQNKLIEVEHSQPFFANFTLRGRDLGGVAYSGIGVGANRDTVVRRVHFDEAWRGFAAIPNGETAGFGINSSTYVIENCLFTPNLEEGSSPIMWNSTRGGSMTNVKVEKHNIGMMTFWHSQGVNTFTNVHTRGSKIGINLEENVNDFELRWNGGSIILDSNISAFHLNINPATGSEMISLTNVEASLNGYTPGMLTAHVYTVAGVQKRSDVTWDGGQISYVPSNNWIN